MSPTATVLADVAECASIRVTPESLGDDLFVVKRYIYWTDLFMSSALGWGFLAGALFSDQLVFRVLFSGFAAIALYRAVVFTHEIVHLRKGAVPGFSVIWHLFCGIPFLAPHFMYRGIHLTHHNRQHYATQRDGEYFPFAKGPVGEILFFLLSGLFLPALAIIRFGFLAPVSCLHPRLRRLIVKKASSMGVRTIFSREAPTNPAERREWVAYEAMCCTFVLTSFGLLFFRVIPFAFFIHWYITVMLIVTLNAIRAICCTHFYLHDHNVPVSLQEQIEDSINVDNSSIMTLLMCPVGTRFHALHHIFPTVPYHSLGKAHRRLRSILPEDSYYHSLVLPTLWEGWRRVWPRSLRK